MQTMQYADEEQREEAIKACKKSIDETPNDADLYNDLGIAFEEAGKVTEAEGAYQKAVELDPRCSSAFYNLGLMYEEQERFAEAIGSYQKCIKHSKDSSERSDARKKIIALIADTPTGQSKLAYRIAACLLILNFLLNIVGILMIGTTSASMFGIIGGIVDLILAVGLFQLRPGARNVVFFRAFVGAIAVPIWMFLVTFNADILSTLIVSTIQWGYCGSLILILTGQSKVWRLVISVLIFLVFALGFNILSLLLYVIAGTMGLSS